VDSSLRLRYVRYEGGLERPHTGQAAEMALFIFEVSITLADSQIWPG
jgi:hypothetical protein